MPRTRTTGIAAAIAALLALAGCSTPASTATATPAADQTGSAAPAAFPVTIDHAFGSTTLEKKPTRVVTIGWGSADAALALGVVPVAIPYQSYGGDSSGVLPWIKDALDKLDAKTPTILPESQDDPPYEDIAAANPDVILAVYSGITDAQYKLLSQIAPTVAYPDQAWSTPWRDVVTTVGTALGESAKATKVLSDIDAQVAAKAAAHPEFQGKSLAAVWDVSNTFYVYKKADPRVEFMLDLGFTNAPAVDELANGESTFYYTLSYEQLDKLKSDVVVSYSDTQKEADAFLASPKDLAIPAVKAGAVAQLVGTSFIASVSPPTALSLPWGLDTLVDQLAKAVK
ncbi:iron-siderophore ABC transporter substrate-binding protein [soil metagenome]